VQVGDPFTEKCLLEACLELMASGAVIAIQDMGAAGLTCSAVEMGAKGDLGILLEPRQGAGARRADVGLRDDAVGKPGAHAHGAAPREGRREAKAIFTKWGLDFAIVGETTDDLRFRVMHRARKSPTCRSRISATSARI
jgi:phosphoribosylformylglycinamidine (FGAM) synthase-like enzyme